MNILTFDIEEWFHILDNHSAKTEADWSTYDSRLQQNIERIFAMLERKNSKATFFVLGWIAEQYPEIIKAITEKGYEVGCHSSMHQLVYEQTPSAFAADLDRSLKTLEDISGKKVTYYRAPGFSIREQEAWAFEKLAAASIEVDCSVFLPRVATAVFLPMGRQVRH
jgi:peptidoglycan-N-acetylglucosamine deacetylase